MHCAGALAGIVVADFSRVLAGPYATMLLGDLGATVVKVESPSGDDTRRWGPPWANGTSTYYQSVNRNKRSVVLDLTTPAGRAAAHRLIERSDVLVENFRTGGADRLGIGYTVASRLNPALVYCSITGYGAAAAPAYDLVVQAVSGLVSLTGPDPEHTTKAGVPIVDVVTGLHAAVGVLAALHHRTVTGRGQRVELNLLSSMLSGMVNFTGAYALTGHVARAMGIAHPSICPYEPYPTADRPLVVAAGNDRQFAALCAELDLPRLPADPRFASNDARVAHRAELAELLSRALAGDGADAWADRLAAAGVPCGPVNDVAGGVALAERLGLRPVVDVAGVPQVASPWTMTVSPVSYRTPPPPLGADTEEVLRWLGEPVVRRPCGAYPPVGNQPEGRMGTWGTGPFDNDTAADWCGDLDEAAPAERVEMIREALERVAGEEDYLDGVEAEVAIAAAAVLAAQLTGDAVASSPYAPTFLTDGERLDLPADLADLAVQALDRVMADDSEWRELWAETDDAPAAFARVSELREVLS